MAEEVPGQGGQEEVQDILSDLDNILQTLTESAREVQAATSALPPAPQTVKPAEKPPSPVKPEVKPPIPPARPPIQPVKPPAQPIKPPTQPVKPAEKPPSPVRPEVKPPAPGPVKPPVMAPFGEPAQVEPPQPSLPPSVVERVIVDLQPKPPPQVVPEVSGIELAPRSGIFPSTPKKDKSEAAGPPKRGLPTPAFVEIPGAAVPPPVQGVPESAAAKGTQDRGASATPVELEISVSPAPEEPKLELKPPPPSAEPKPEPKPAAPIELKVDLTPESAIPVEVREAPQDAAVAPPAPVPVFSGPAAFAANADPIPDKTPADQIRRIAFLYTSEQQEVCEKFVKFIGQVAKTFGKKPIYVHPSARAEVRADVSPRELLDKLKAAGTVGILAILEGLPADKVQELEKVFEDEDIFFRVVAAAETSKRLSAIDHVVDMMLLKAG